MWLLRTHGQQGLNRNISGDWRCMEVAGLSGARLIATDPWRTGVPGHTGRPQSCVDQVLGSIRG